MKHIIKAVLITLGQLLFIALTVALVFGFIWVLKQYPNESLLGGKIFVIALLVALLFCVNFMRNKWSESKADSKSSAKMYTEQEYKNEMNESYQDNLRRAETEEAIRHYK